MGLVHGEISRILEIRTPDGRDNGEEYRRSQGRVKVIKWAKTKQYVRLSSLTEQACQAGKPDVPGISVAVDDFWPIPS